MEHRYSLELASVTMWRGRRVAVAVTVAVVPVAFAATVSQPAGDERHVQQRRFLRKGQVHEWLPARSMHGRPFRTSG